MQGITSRGQWSFLCGWCHHELGQRSSIQYAGGRKSIVCGTMFIVNS